MAIDTGVENFFDEVLKALAASTPQRRPLDDPRPPIPAGIQDELYLKNRLWRQWHITRDLALKAEVNRLQRSVPAGSTSGEMTSAAQRSNLSILKTNRCGG
jgi:hypothetical protein